MTAELRAELIRYQIGVLTRLFPVRPAADTAVPKRLFLDRKFTEMFKWVRDTLGLDGIGLRVGYVNHGGPADSCAWVVNLGSIPLYGGEQFRRFRVDVFIRKTYLEEAPFEAVLSTMAHEMAHVLLYGLRHPLHRNEMATDLAAMVLGFAEVFCSGRVYIPVGSRGNAKNLGDITKMLEEFGSYKGSGYLRSEELTYALQLIRNKRA